MKRINFQNGITKVNDETFNAFQNNIEESAVIVSPTEPTTNEKVWLKKDSVLGDKIFCKTENNTENNWEEFKLLNDTGWIDMSAYINTDYFAPRPEVTPMARKIGKVVYWKGYVYCIKDTNTSEIDIMVNLPEWAKFDAGQEFARPFMMWGVFNYGVMYINGGNIRIGQNSNISNVGINNWQAYSLASISGYISKGE